MTHSTPEYYDFFGKPEVSPVYSMLDAARLFKSWGICTIPCNQAKRPHYPGLGTRSDGSTIYLSWDKHKTRLPTDTELDIYFEDEPLLAIICGKVSGNVEGFDFDMAGEFYQPFHDAVEAEAPGLMAKTVIENTQSGGKHVTYKCETIEGNQPLAQKFYLVEDKDIYLVPRQRTIKGVEETIEDEYTKSVDGKPKKITTHNDKKGVLITMIETRGEAGYLVVGPSRGYKVIQGSYAKIPTITTAERSILFKQATLLNEYHRANSIKPDTHVDINFNEPELRPGDDYNQRGDIRELLQNHGWQQGRTSGDFEHWTRPGRTLKEGKSASIIDNKFFKVFSSNADPFVGEQVYSKFSVYTVLEHEGNYSEAARALSQQGFGTTTSMEVVNIPQSTGEFTELKPLKKMPPVLKFDYDQLPKRLVPYVKNNCRRMGMVPDYTAIAIFSSMGKVLGSKLRVQPKANDYKWWEWLNPWSLGVGGPGSMKTPGMSLGYTGVYKLVKDANIIYEDELKDYFKDSKKFEQYKKAEVKAIAKLYEEGNHRRVEADQKAEQLGKDEPREPQEKRYIVNDITPEKLVDLQNYNTDGLMMIKDEMIGLLSLFKKPGYEVLKAILNEGYDGKKGISVDRKGSGTKHCPRNLITLSGTVQPGPLLTFLSEVEAGAEADGHIQRYGLMCFPDPLDNIAVIDEAPSHEVDEDFIALFDYLEDIDATIGPEYLYEHARNNPLNHAAMRFDNEAQGAFIEWLSDINKEIKSGHLSEMMEGYVSKFRKLIPVMCALIHVCDHGLTSMTMSSWKKALKWEKYLRSHYTRVHEMKNDKADVMADLISQLLLARELSVRFVKPDIYQGRGGLLANTDDVELGLSVLVSRGWLRIDKQKTRGRPKVEYVTNEDIYGMCG